MNPLLPVLALLCSSTLWGLTWLALKHFGHYGLAGPWVTLLAHGSVGVCALPMLWITRKRWRARTGSLLGLAFVGGLANLAFASAILAGDVLRVMVLFYLLPAWGVLGGRFFLGERIDGPRWASLGLALSGAFLVLGGPRVFLALPTWVDVSAVISGMALALHNVIFRKRQDVPVPIKTGFNFVGCLVWAAIVVGSMQRPPPTDVPPLVWVEVVAFGLVWILAATVGTLWGVHHLEAGRSSILIIVELVTAVVSAALIGGRVPKPIEWGGGCLIVLAALIEARRGGRSEISAPLAPSG